MKKKYIRRKNPYHYACIEIDIDRQRLTLYDSQFERMSFPCVTGAPGIYETNPGSYCVYEKKNDKTVCGINYRYWLGYDSADFGIGIQERKDSFPITPETWLDHGTTGCVQCDEKDMEKLYEAVQPGLPVLVRQRGKDYSFLDAYRFWRVKNRLDRKEKLLTAFAMLLLNSEIENEDEDAFHPGTLMDAVDSCDPEAAAELYGMEYTGTVPYCAEALHKHLENGDLVLLKMRDKSINPDADTNSDQNVYYAVTAPTYDGRVILLDPVFGRCLLSEGGTPEEMLLFRNDISNERLYPADAYRTWHKLYKRTPDFMTAEEILEFNRTLPEIKSTNIFDLNKDLGSFPSGVVAKRSILMNEPGQNGHDSCHFLTSVYAGEPLVILEQDPTHEWIRIRCTFCEGWIREREIRRCDSSKWNLRSGSTSIFDPNNLCRECLRYLHGEIGYGESVFTNDSGSFVRNIFMKFGLLLPWDAKHLLALPGNKSEVSGWTRERKLDLLRAAGCGALLIQEEQVMIFLGFLRNHPYAFTMKERTCYAAGDHIKNKHFCKGKMVDLDPHKNKPETDDLEKLQWVLMPWK